MPEVLRAQPDVPGDLGPCSSACGSNSSPARLGPGSDGLRGRPKLTSDSCLGPWTHGVDQFPHATRPRAEGSRGPPALGGDSRSSLSARGVDQHSWATRAPVRGPAGWTSSLRWSGLGPMAHGVGQLTGDLAPTSYSPRGRPALPGYRVWVRWPRGRPADRRPRARLL